MGEDGHAGISPVLELEAYIAEDIVECGRS